MNETQAQELCNELAALLSGRDLISVSSTPSGLDVRQGERFEKAYYVKHDDGQCSVALCDTYGVMTGAEDWSFDETHRGVVARTTNAFGERCQFAWIIAGIDDDGKVYDAVKAARMRRLRAFYAMPQPDAGKDSR